MVQDQDISVTEVPITNQSTSTRHNVEGALLVGIALVFYLAYALIPVIGGPLVILCPLPLIVLALRHPLRVVITGNMVATVLAGLLTGQPFAFITFLLVFSLPASAMGLSIRSGLSAKSVILLGGTAMVAGSIGLFFITIGTVGEVDSIDSLKYIFKSGVEKQKVLLADKIREQGVTEGWPDKKIETLIEGNEKMLESLGQMFWKTLPAALILGFLLESLINYLVAGAVLKRLGYSIPKLGKFLEFKLPWYSVWLLICTIAFLAGGRKFNLDWMDTIGLNLQVVATILFFVHGLAIVLFFVERLRARMKAGRFPVYLILTSVFFMFNAFAFMLTAFLGIYDLYFDFRNRVNISPISPGAEEN